VRRGKARGFVGEATSIQLHRIGFKSRPNLSFETLTENGKAIYRHAERKFGLAKWNIEPLTAGWSSRLASWNLLAAISV